MKYTYFGKTGFQVSTLCYGTMSFGGDADEKTSAAMFHRCREAGINFFDCADMYSKGVAEEILGRLIADCRDEVIITSKGYYPTGEDINARGASPRHLTSALEASLKRLNTDRIEIYFVHHFDDHTPVESTLRALDDLVRQGKILHIAASNFAAWQVAKALGIAVREGLAAFECIQPMYNLLKRQAEVELLPMALSENLAVIPYSPLAAGILTGKYRKKQKPKVGRLLTNTMYQGRYAEDWQYEVANNFSDLARKHGHDPAALAVAWVAAHPAVTAPIIGARNVQQLEGSLKSVDIEIDDDLYRQISALSPEPGIATDRSEEL